MNHQASSDETEPSGWLGRREIRAITGALKPSAYVQRAYLYAQQHQALPPWARKTGRGQWLFTADYIKNDARDNRRTVNVSQAARMLGTTRRTIQNWIDEGILESLGEGEHAKGETRRVLREPFLAQMDSLRARLATPANLGRRAPEGKPRAPRRPASTPAEMTREAKRQAARALEERLQAATRPRRRTPAAAEGAAAQARAEAVAQARAEAAAAARELEAQLRQAQELQRDREQWERRAGELAQRIVDDMLDDTFGRFTALLLYNRLAKREHIPDEVRVAVRKKWFGR